MFRRDSDYGSDQVDAREVEKLAAVEDAMWWFRGLHGVLAGAIRRHAPAGPVLDAGSGTGGFLKRLASAMPGRVLAGLDRDPLAATLAGRRWGGPVAVGSVDRMPFPDAHFAAIVSADVLCHAGVDEETAIAEAHRCLMPGGIYVLNLPAYDWMFSDHDRAVDTARRYTRRGIGRQLEAAGFGRTRASYWNTLLFPLMVARRKLLPRGASDVSLGPAPVERLFGGIVGLEERWISAGRGLPFGGSVLAVGIKT